MLGIEKEERPSWTAALPHHQAARGDYVPLREQTLDNVLDIDDQMLRGVTLPDLLAGRARLFAENGQAARDDPSGTYALSRPVGYLSRFLSHSWKTSRLVKYAALCVHFNLARAAVVSAIAQFFVFTFITFNIGSLPVGGVVITDPQLADQAPSKALDGCEFVTPILFPLVLFFGHRLFGVDDGTFFLDVCCISQDDETLKASGISSLGAILDRSERMLVLCDGHYFSRLWCLFELSAFSKRAGSGRIDFVPLHVPLCLVGWIFSFALFYGFMLMLYPLVAMTAAATGALSSGGSELLAIFLPLFSALCMLVGLVVVMYAELEACEIQEACAKLRTFKLTDAQCFSDADRAAIISLIGKWWTDTGSGEADPERLRQLGVHRFERFVRHELAPQLAEATGRSMTPGKLFCIYIMACNGWIMDMISFQGTTPYHVLAYLTTGALCFGLWLPGLMQSIKALAGVAWRQKQAGWPALAYNLIFFVASFAWLVVSFVLVYVLPFPNQLLDPSFRWPNEGLSEFGNVCFKFQVVLGLYCLGAGLAYASQ